MTLVTRWLDNKCKKVEDALKIMSNPSSNNDEGHGSSSLRDLVTTKVLDANEKIVVKDKVITFNVIRYTYNKVSTDDPDNPLPLEDRTVSKSGSVVVYADGQRVRYIINRNYDAQRVLRFLLGYTGKGEIIKNQPVLKSDMFIWLIKKIYLEENDIDLDDDTPVLRIDNLTEFRGQTEDSTNMVVANGDTIMKILSTLSFLLESNNMKQVKINVAYDEHKSIELVLAKGTIGTSVKNYLGIFQDDDNSSLSKEDSNLIIEAKVYLISYLAILPEIIQTYEDAVDENEWTPTVHKTFLKRVADDLQQKINDRVQDIDQ